MSDVVEIDTTFDMRADTPAGLDPDTFSPTLRRYHQLLWQKPLPSGEIFALKPEGRTAYLVNYGSAGRLPLSSDTVITSHRKRAASLYSQVPESANQEFHRLGYTIGGFLLFPGAQIGRLQTINQARGMSRLIEDRLDLTLECIRRHYLGGDLHSPLREVIARYEAFFTLFGSFEHYIDFFLLNDMVDEAGRIRFFRSFDGFSSSALPKSLDEYTEYRRLQLTFLERRNQRVAEWWDRNRARQLAIQAEIDSGNLA